MPSYLKVRGNPVREFGSFSHSTLKKVAVAVEVAVAESMVEIQDRAMLILENQIYEKPRPPFARELTEELLHSWEHRLKHISYGTLGILTNTSGHAGYIEFGTTEHDITAKKAPMLGRRRKRSGSAYLHWIDPDTGVDMFAQRVHVSGVEATHFLEVAASMIGPSGPAIVITFEKALKKELS